MKFILFHGAYGSPNENWFPWLKKELEKLNQQVYIPRFPIENWDCVNNTGPSFIPKKQTLSRWLSTFEKGILPKIHKRDKLCFIGHSLGPVFILHAAATFQIRLECAYFVAPFLKVKGLWQFYNVNKSFYKTDFDFAKLRKFIPVSFAYYSDNDPYLPNKYSRLFAQKMGSDITVVKNAGHFNVASDEKFKKFPLLLGQIKLRITQQPEEYI